MSTLGTKEEAQMYLLLVLLLLLGPGHDLDTLAFAIVFLVFSAHVQGGRADDTHALAGHFNC